MKPLLALGVVLPVLAMALPAAAQRTSRVDGNKLLQVCSSKAGAAGCEAYISGVSDTIALYQEASRESHGAMKVPAAVCVPAQVTGAQMREIVVAWLKQNPANRGRQAAQVVYRAMRDKYPCR